MVVWVPRSPTAVQVDTVGLQGHMEDALRWAVGAFL